MVCRRVRDLLRSTYPLDRREVLVALDSASRWAPEDLAELAKWDAVRVVKSAEAPGKASTLNVGVEHSRGELLIFADTSQRFPPETVSELVSAFSHPRIGGASGRLVLRRRGRGLSPALAYWAFERWLRKREGRIHSPVGVTGAVSALRKSLWKPLPEGLILDDVHTPMRVVLEGYRIAFVESAVAFETRLPTPTHEHDRKVRTLTGVLQLCTWLPDVLVPWRNPIFIQFVFHKLARLLTPYAIVLVALWACWSLAESQPTIMLVVALVAAVFLAWVWMGLTTPARNVRAVLLELILIQVAVVRATAHGLRGNWDIWR